MATSSVQMMRSPILIGRAQPLATLEQLLTTARAGHGQVALISGEAGIGKTRLVRELADLAQAQGWALLDAHCFPQDRLCPYAPVLDLFRTHFWQRPDELAAFSGELAPLLPDLLPGSAAAPPVALDSEQEKRRRFAALARFFAQQAERQPLLLIVEDIHWSDDLSLELLFTLARQCAERPILLVLTYRSDESEQVLLPWLAQLDRARLGQEVALAPLSRDDVAGLLGALFALERPARPEFLNALYSLTEGNPFFLEEVLKSLVAAGEIFYHDGIWDHRPLSEIRIPRSVQDAVGRRAAQVSESARHVLALAAVAGRRFDFALLLALSGLTEQDLLAVLKELIAAQLIAEESSERFAFRHALVREAIYSDLLARERAALHRAIGTAIEGIAGQSVEQYLPELSYHFFEAGAWEQAQTYAWRAGEQALRLDAPRAAVEQLTHAADAARRMNLQPDPALLRLRGQAYETLGEFERAEADCTLALRLAEERHDQRTEWQALLALGLLWSSRDYDQAGRFLQRALVLARGLDDPAALARSLNRLGNWYLNAEAPREAEPYHQEAFALFQALDDRRGLAETLDLLGMAAATGGDLRRSFAYYQDAIEAFRALDDHQGLVTPLIMQCVGWNSYLMLDGGLLGVPLDMERVTRQGEEALLLAQESGWRAGEAFVHYELSMTIAAHGAYSRGLDSGRRALAISEEIQHRQWLIGSHVVLGRLCLDVLALSQAREHLEQALELARVLRSSNWSQMAGAMLAMTYIQQGAPDLANTLLAETFDWSAPPQALSQRLGWCARAEVALARNDPVLALSCIDQLLAARADRSPQATVIPRLGLLQGEIRATLGEWSAAEETLRATLAAAQELGLQPMVWRVHHALAHVFQKQRRHEQARESLLAAHAVIEALADDLPSGQLRETFLRQARARVPLPRAPRASSPRQSTRQLFNGLTAREHEVAIQLAQGKSNREIADELVVSERTVEYHVGNILGKLALTSRSQVAVWALEHGLAEPSPDSQ
jgi:DNA-binding CsgD family transcriptional regulator